MPDRVKMYQCRGTRSRCQSHRTKGEVQGLGCRGRPVPHEMSSWRCSRPRRTEVEECWRPHSKAGQPNLNELKPRVLAALVMLSPNCDLCAQCGGMKAWVVMGAFEGSVAARRSTSLLLSLSISYTVSRGYQPCLLIIVIGGDSAAPVSKLCRRSSASARLLADPVGDTAGS